MAVTRTRTFAQNETKIPQLVESISISYSRRFFEIENIFKCMLCLYIRYGTSKCEMKRKTAQVENCLRKS